jgi:proteasome regulatory subunit
MSRSPSLPDRPRLDLDPEMSPEERLDALREHFIKLEQVNDELTSQLDSAQERRDNLSGEVDRLERENETLKTSSLYIATAEEVTDEGVIVKQHGNNQEVLTEVSPNLKEELEAGDRVAINDSFSVQTLLDAETDARAQAMQVDHSPDVVYEDIGGLDEQIREVREAVEQPLVDAEQFREVGIEPPSGVLLHGPPGTGKTMLAKAVANETDATFIKMAGSELVRKFIGEGARLVRDLFELASEREPAIIFIDEIDAIAAKRTESRAASASWRSTRRTSTSPRNSTWRPSPQRPRASAVPNSPASPPRPGCSPSATAAPRSAWRTSRTPGRRSPTRRVPRRGPSHSTERRYFFT